jgi:hypothetical protein
MRHSLFRVRFLLPHIVTNPAPCEGLRMYRSGWPASLQAPVSHDAAAAYFALEKSSTAYNWPLRSAIPTPIESMSLSRMLPWCRGDFMKLW